MNNEPVAWISVLGIDLIGQKFTDVRVSLTKTDVASIPLYTHPVKEPTDLELLKMIGEKFTRFGFEGDYVVEDSELVEFARAILRKAQEK